VAHVGEAKHAAGREDEGAACEEAKAGAERAHDDAVDAVEFEHVERATVVLHAKEPVGD